MNDAEELLRRTLRTHAEQAPTLKHLQHDRAAPAKWRIAAPLGAAIAVAALASAAFVLTPSHNPQEATTAPAATNETDISQLTGEAVGDALGLQVLTGDVDGCDLGAEFKDGYMYCLDGVTDDPVEAELLALQVMGYQRTDTAIAYAKSIAAYSAAKSDSAGSEDTLALWTDMLNRGQKLEDEQPDVTKSAG